MSTYAIDCRPISTGNKILPQNKKTVKNQGNPLYQFAKTKIALHIFPSNSLINFISTFYSLCRLIWVDQQSKLPQVYNGFRNDVYFVASSEATPFAFQLIRAYNSPALSRIGFKQKLLSTVISNYLFEFLSHKCVVCDTFQNVCLARFAYIEKGKTISREGNVCAVCMFKFYVVKNMQVLGLNVNHTVIIPPHAMNIPQNACSIFEDSLTYKVVTRLVSMNAFNGPIADDFLLTR